jgi:hypothetical protein
MKKLILNSIFITGLMLLVVCDNALAQRNSDDRPGKSGEAPGRSKDVPGVPIDGGVGALLATGLLYGLKKLNDHNKGKNKEEVA